jgi:hypothetical protein
MNKSLTREVIREVHQRPLQPLELQMSMEIKLESLASTWPLIALAGLVGVTWVIGIPNGCGPQMNVSRLSIGPLQLKSPLLRRKTIRRLNDDAHPVHGLLYL